jgi:hypothetical protein
MNNVMLYEKIRTILLHDWDPIGVSDLPDAQDEYDSYVHPISEMLNQGKSVNEIYTYLQWVVNDYMCLDGNEDVERAIAEKLVNLLITH